MKQRTGCFSSETFISKKRRNFLRCTVLSWRKLGKNRDLATRYVDSMHPSPENFIPLPLVLCYMPLREKLRKKEYWETIGDIAQIAPPAILGQHVRRFRLFPSVPYNPNHRNPCRLLEPSGYSLCANYKEGRSLTCINAGTWSRKSNEAPVFRVNIQSHVHTSQVFLGIP